ncbi:MAG: alpha/beta fold hydrolase, partial [Coriobacteriia bacterium]|nr:alpha/beta fold hydrolase [Coriobacteriia bacterium]
MRKHFKIRVLLATMAALALPIGIQAQCIMAEKFADCDVSMSGHEVTYIICVENCSGEVALENITVYDLLLGDLSSHFPWRLLPRETVCLEFSYVIQSDDPDPVVNTVMVTAQDEFGAIVSAQAVEEVDQIHPSLELYQECLTPQVQPGGSAEFLIDVYNEGDCNLVVTTSEPEMYGPFTLSPGESRSEIVTRTVPSGEDEVCNEVEAMATLPPEYCDLDSTYTAGEMSCCDVDWAATVYGYVFDESEAGARAGVGGVTVAVMQGASVVATAVTSSEGAYIFYDLYPGDYAVRATLDGWEMNTQHVTLTSGETRQADFAFHRLPADPLFADDFDAGNADAWETTGACETGGCTWDVASGEYLTSNSGHRQWCISNTGYWSWTDYVFEADVLGEAGVDKVILVRYMANTHFYAINLRSDWGGLDEVTISKMYACDFTADIVSAEYPSCNGVWYRVRAVVRGSTIAVYIDDQLVLEWTDEDPLTIDNGKVGVACWTGDADECSVRFDNVLVAEYPHAPTQLTVTDACTGDHLKVTCSPAPALGSHYVIYKGEAAGPPFDDYVCLEHLRPGSTGYTDDAVEEGKRYYYTVRACMGQYWSDYSAAHSGVAHRPIVFVHGLNGSPDNWNWMISQFELMGYPDLALYKCTGLLKQGTFDENAARLRDCVNAACAAIQSEYGVRPTKVNIIAHSMGGLVARHYMHGLPPTYAHMVDKVIMLGTPNTGSGVIDLVSGVSILPHTWCPWAGDACQDLTSEGVDAFLRTWGDGQSGCD